MNLNIEIKDASAYVLKGVTGFDRVRKIVSLLMGDKYSISVIYFIYMYLRENFRKCSALHGAVVQKIAMNGIDEEDEYKFQSMLQSLNMTATLVRDIL